MRKVHKIHEICSSCGKIKPYEEFSFKEKICNNCLELLNEYKERPLKKFESTKKTYFPRKKRMANPTIQVMILRDHSCICPLSHLLLLFCEETKEGWEHTKACQKASQMHLCSIEELIKK